MHAKTQAQRLRAAEKILDAVGGEMRRATAYDVKRDFARRNDCEREIQRLNRLLAKALEVVAHPSED